MKTFRTRTRTNAPGLFLIAAAVLFFAACSPAPDPRTAAISAATPGDFAKWRDAAYEKFSPAERDEFDQCINYIRLGIRMRNEASGDDAVAQAVCGRVNGKTVREVLIASYTEEAERLTRDIAQQRENLAKTDAVINGPGSDGSKVGARAFRVAVVDAIDKLEARLARARARLGELGKDGP